RGVRCTRRDGRGGDEAPAAELERGGLPPVAGRDRARARGGARGARGALTRPRAHRGRPATLARMSAPSPYGPPRARPPATGPGISSSGPAPRRGPHLGPIRITPVRVTLFVALLGGLAFLAWSTFDRDQLQVPLMATGFAICGIVFAVTAIL